MRMECKNHSRGNIWQKRQGEIMKFLRKYALVICGLVQSVPLNNHISRVPLLFFSSSQNVLIFMACMCVCVFLAKCVSADVTVACLQPEVGCTYVCLVTWSMRFASISFYSYIYIVTHFYSCLVRFFSFLPPHAFILFFMMLWLP